jgi:hypothetical protein
MPTEPQDYLAILNLQAALQGISTGAGYYNDVMGSAVRLDPDQNVSDLAGPGGPRPFVIIDFGDSEERWEYANSRQLRLQIPFHIVMVVNSTPNVDESRVQAFLRGCADVEKAIAADHNRGGYATDTRITSRHFRWDGKEMWIRISAELWFNRFYGQPQQS